MNWIILSKNSKCSLIKSGKLCYSFKFFRIKGGGVWPIIHWTPMRPLNIFFRSSNKFAAAEFDSSCRLLKRHCSLFCSCIHNFYTKQHLEPHIYWVFYLLGTVLVLFSQKQVSSKNVYIFLSSNVQDGCTSPIRLNSIVIRIDTS